MRHGDRQTLELVPPDGVRQPRASAWCGTEGHERLVIVARDEREMWKRLDQWRCGTCGVGNV